MWDYPPHRPIVRPLVDPPILQSSEADALETTSLILSLSLDGVSSPGDDPISPSLPTVTAGGLLLEPVCEYFSSQLSGCAPVDVRAVSDVAGALTSLDWCVLLQAR